MSGPVLPAVTESPGPAPTGPRRPGSPPGPAARALPPFPARSPGFRRGRRCPPGRQVSGFLTHTPAGPSQSESSSSQCQWPGGLHWQESKSSVTALTGPGPVAMIGAITQKLRRLCRNYAEIKQIMHKLRRNYGLPVGIKDWADWDLQGPGTVTGTARRRSPLSHGQ